VEAGEAVRSFYAFQLHPQESETSLPQTQPPPHLSVIEINKYNRSSQIPSILLVYQHFIITTANPTLTREGPVNLWISRSGEL
jgi:hypothetical protein